MGALAGELAPGTLPGVLRTIYVERRTGLLHVTRDQERGTVCFIHGNIVYGATNITECQLGETLVRHGLLSQRDRERARGMVTATGQRLGQILMDLGLLTAEGLEDGLALQVREVLLTIFTWPAGRYVFEDQDPENFRGYDKPLRLSTGEVILDAVWSISDPQVIQRALGDLDRVLTPASDPLLRFQSIALSPTDGFILSRVDGVASAKEILAMAPVDTAEAERSLCGLVYTGMVEFLKPVRAEAAKNAALLRRTLLEAHAALPGQNHFEVLGVPPTATASELLAAYFRLARLYHPDQHHQAELRDHKGALEALFARVGEAHRVLSDSRARAAYEFGLVKVPTPVAPTAPRRAAPEPEAVVDPQKVDEGLARADELMAAGRAWDAILAVDEILPLATGRARRRGRLLKAQAHLRVGDGAKAAEEELKAALAEDPAHPEAHYLLGTLYQAGGASALAGSEFRKALALKPRYHEAQAALLSLGPPPEPSSEAGRLFRRLIGR
jgi:tetratricopeptide (TPR) repeat protein